MRTVVIPIESSRSSGRSLLRGIANYSKLHGPWNCYWEPGGLEEVFPRLRNLNAEGIIMRDSDRLEEVLQLGIPVIIFGHHHEKIPGVVNLITDSRTIGRMAAEHLLDCGLKSFAYCGVDDKSWSIERSISFSNRIALAGHDVKIYRQPYFPERIAWEKEQTYIVEWLHSLPKPVGLMSCNDDRNQQVLQACKVAHYKIPEEIALIGVDNDELICDLSDPPLSSVSVNFERAGFEGAVLLERWMQGEKPGCDEITIQATHVMVRQSSDITAIDDPAVAEAVSFIRKNARKNICVDDVVAKVPLSRRVLEKRFREQLNRSILEEIRRIRTTQIAQMLVETNLSVTQIAMGLGFQGDEHIARYFRSQMKMSPLQYRKEFGKK